jgi:serine/threonine protein kinase/tetratricopeptide (TPR) repeat protein
MSSSSDERGPVELLADEFLVRCKRGEKPTIKEYCTAHPKLADEIRDVFEAVLMVEDLKPGSDEVSGSLGEGAQVAGKRLQQVGDYRILCEIGRGGMGVVYEAEQQALGRRVALKVLPRISAGDSSALIRFQREAKAAARMHHTNIVPVFDVGQDVEHLYYAMQLIHGQSLDLVIDDLKRLQAQSGATPTVPDQAADQSIAASLVVGKFETESLAPEGEAETKATAAYEGILPSSAVLPGQSEISTATTNRGAYFRSVAQIGGQTASALSYAHSRGIIHRDIKPGNLILDTTGNVWVTDFGLAKTGDGGVTHTGDILGTVRYMAPERFRGQCDVRADVYALGMTLYELLTLKAAYASGDRLKLIELIRHKEAASPRSIDARIPRDLETIVMKAIDKDPKRRYQSADEVGEDLQRFVSDEPIKARRIGAAERLTRWCRRNPAVGGLTAAVLLLMAAGTAVSSWQAVRAAESEQKALAAAAAEKEAKETAEAREAETNAVLDFVRNKVFAAARPQGAEGGLGHDVTLRKAVEAALPFVDKSFTNQPLIEARLRMTLGASFFDLGEWKIAVEQGERARTLYMQQRGPDHPDTLVSTVNLAHTYSRVGRARDAVALLKQALPVMKAKMPDHRSRLSCMTVLAENLAGVGRNEEALKLHEEVLELCKAKFGPDDPALLGGIVNLAVAYRAVGRLTDAIKLLEEVLPGMKAKMPDHDFTFLCMDHLANAYAAAGRTQEALTLYEGMLELEKAKLGLDHPYTLRCMNGLANSYADTGRTREALNLREEVFPRMKAKLGPDHADTLHTMNSLAIAYARAGRTQEAAKLMEESLRLNKANLGPDDITLESMVNLAQSYFRIGRPKDAIHLCEQALPILKAKMPDAQITAVCISVLALSLGDVGRAQEALKLHEEALQLYKAKLGSEHAATLGGTVNLAIGYRAVGRLPDAIKLLEEALPVMKAKMPDHEYTFNCLSFLASGYAAARRPQEAIKLFEEMLRLQKAKLGPEHPQALGTMTDLAISYAAAGRHQEALQLREKTLQLSKVKLGPDNASTLGGMVNLAQSYHQLGRLKDAIELYEQALPIMRAKMPGHQFTVNCMTGLAGAYIDAGRSQDGLKLFEEELQVRKAKLGPDHRDTLALLDHVSVTYLAAAAQQAWFGNEEEWAATCERALSNAQDTKIATVADRVAKLCSLRPSDEKTHQAALLLARRAVELGKGHRYMPYFLTALGMAEYRSGHFTEADAALAAAIEAGKDNPHVAGTSAFYRAMSLFRLGKEDQAKQLATQAAANMKPLPKDDKKPLAGGANADDLILWLVYKEARDLIKLDEKCGSGTTPGDGADSGK